MLQHPEQTNHEVFVGNRKVINWPDSKLSTLMTARLGKVAYDVFGKKLTASDGMKPLFIGKCEAGRYDKIMMEGLRK